MDPFSITVGAIGLAGAANKATGGVIKQIKALRDAPEELQDLLAELSQFELVLQTIQNAADPSGTTHSLLETLLDTAKDKILELHRLIEYRLTKAGTSSEVDRSQWAGSQKDVDRLRKQLTNIRANVHVNLSTSTNITVENTWGLLRQVNSDNHAMGQMAAALLPKILQEVQSTGAAVTGILENFPHLTLESSHSGLQSVPDTAHGSSLAQTGIQTAYGGSSRQLQPRKTYEGLHCHWGCPCECHRTYCSSISWPLARLYGRVRIERKDSLGVGASHHIKSCKASAVSHIRVIYFVPTWFAMKAYDIRYTSSPLHGPEWLIKIPRLVNRHGNRGFKAIIERDLSMFQSSIANGECTPYDIYEDGSSMLENVVFSWRIDFMAHLVGMGVDFCQSIGTDINLLESLWVWLLGRLPTRFPSQDSEPLPKLIPSFPLDEYIENEGFTLLHEIVCRLNGRDLDSALQTRSADVNKLSKEGQSPLEMAVRLVDIAAIRTLLKRGADPNIGDGVPLSETLSEPCLVMVDVLLRSGATVHGPAGDQAVKTWVNRGHYGDQDVAERLAIDRLLIEYGVDVNRQVFGRTKLMVLCQEHCWNTIDGVKQIIGLGADLELRDTEGYTALHWAICAENSMVIETLLHSGARIDVKTDEGNTIAHLAVICCKVIKTPKAMSDLDPGGLDLNLKNEDGHTVFDLLRKRNGLRWEAYYSEWYERMANRIDYEYLWHPSQSRAYEDEYEIILALEALLHHIQDLQGIPKDQQYPPLGEYLSDDKDEDPVPGAWPV